MWDKSYLEKLNEYKEKSIAGGGAARVENSTLRASLPPANASKSSLTREPSAKSAHSVFLRALICPNPSAFLATAS